MKTSPLLILCALVRSRHKCVCACLCVCVTCRFPPHASAGKLSERCPGALSDLVSPSSSPLTCLKVTFAVTFPRDSTLNPRPAAPSCTSLHPRAPPRLISIQTSGRSRNQIQENRGCLGLVQDDGSPPPPTAPAWGQKRCRKCPRARGRERGGEQLSCVQQWTTNCPSEVDSGIRFSCAAFRSRRICRRDWMSGAAPQGS